jgi:hypothetical protein
VSAWHHRKYHSSCLGACAGEKGTLWSFNYLFYNRKLMCILYACAGEKGTLWSFNYFFYNRKLKRILYFSCRGSSKLCAQESSEGPGYSYGTEDDDDVAGTLEDLG